MRTCELCYDNDKSKLTLIVNNKQYHELCLIDYLNRAPELEVRCAQQSAILLEINSALGALHRKPLRYYLVNKNNNSLLRLFKKIFNKLKCQCWNCEYA